MSNVVILSDNLWFILINISNYTSQISQPQDMKSPKTPDKFKYKGGIQPNRFPIPPQSSSIAFGNTDSTQPL